MLKLLNHFVISFKTCESFGEAKHDYNNLYKSVTSNKQKSLVLITHEIIIIKTKMKGLWANNMLILQHPNAFNKILSDLLTLEVKLEEEDKYLLLLSSLPSSYDHLTTTIIYGKEILQLKDVRQSSRTTS